jgi:hypothetical protein
MAFTGVMRRCPFFLVIIILSAISCIVTLAIHLLPRSFLPTSIIPEYETLPFAEHQENLPVHPAAPQVYMISLLRRTDRREKMRKLRAVTGLSWTFVDATDSTAEIVGRIMERARWTRASAYLHAMDANFRGWWSDDQGELDAYPKGSESWELLPSDPVSADYMRPLPIPPLRDQRLALEVATGHTIPRVGAIQAVDVTRVLFPSADLSSPRTATRAVTNAHLVELPYWRVLTRGTLACWHSHIKLIRTVASETAQVGTNGTAGVIVLEDDVDMELDIQQRISRLWGELPLDWDILFLGK